MEPANKRDTVLWRTITVILVHGFLGQICSKLSSHVCGLPTLIRHCDCSVKALRIVWLEA